MTDKNKTEIAVVLDRSGSMMTIQKDMVGGFATFVDEQKKYPGECRLSLYRFDTDYEVVYENRPIAEVGPLELEPRGGTALNDALGRTVKSLGARLAKLPEEKRPGLVVVVVITDGQENSSREFTHAQVRALVKEQEDKYSWRFVYLGADASTFAEAQAYGIRSSAQYTAGTIGVNALYAAASNSIGAARGAVQCSTNGAVPELVLQEQEGLVVNQDQGT